MITFKSITIKNFISVGDNPITVDLDSSKTNLITGTNGSGKSAILCDSITFVLFGKSYRGINKPNLINTINKKDCVVSIDFVASGNDFHIERGMAPNFFNIYKNGKKYDNTASAKDQQRFLEEEILKCNFRSFCQTCLLGSASYIPFMQLSTGARRDVIETLLYISVFSDMNKILKAKVSDWKNEIDDVKTNIRVSQKAYDMQLEFYQNISESHDNKILKKKNELSKLKQSVIDYNEKIEKVRSEIDKIYVDDISKLIRDLSEEKNKERDACSATMNNIRREEKQLKFFKDNSVCPKCEQEIEEDHKHSHVNELEDTINNLHIEYEESDKKYAELNEEHNTLLETEKKLREYNNQIATMKIQRDNMVSQGSSIVKEIEEMKESDTGALDKEKKKLQDLSVELKAYEMTRNKLLDKKEVYMMATKLLKDTGIKSSIIKQYLPILNARVNHYLNILNFNVKFELDESFNETLKARYKNEFTYANFSMGERQRLDLAITFAWRDIARMKNSVNTNILIFDEVFDSSLDEQGTDDLMTILGEFDDKTNIFIISHKGGLEDKFDTHYSFQKVNGFTKIV